MPREKTPTMRSGIPTVRSQGYAAGSRVLQEQTPVNLALVKLGFLVASIDNIRSARRLLQHTELELATACKVDSRRARNARELRGAGGVVDGGLAGKIISAVGS